jgi:hypothetical protein
LIYGGGGKREEEGGKRKEAGRGETLYYVLYVLLSF